MKFTDSAAQAVLGVMKRKGLNPQKFFLEISVFEGNLGMGFTKDKFGKPFVFGELTVIVGRNIDSSDLTIDFGEINGRQGLIFTEG